MTSDIYTAPKVVSDLGDCVFYHTMEIPGYPLVGGQWDLRETVDAYLGFTDFSGKRVLELGKASGYLTFHMERTGAEVVAYDLDEDAEWDVVPFAKRTLQSDWADHYPDAKLTWREFLASRKAGCVKMNNGFWLAHRAFGSRARLVTGSVYRVPLEIGPVDISTFCSILLHVRDPFLAIHNGARLTRETIVVTDLVPGATDLAGPLGSTRTVPCGPDAGPFACFVPDPQAGGPLDIWWQLSPELIQRMLAVLGFEDSQVSYADHQAAGGPVPFYTVVAHRTAEMPSLDAEA